MKKLLLLACILFLLPCYASAALSVTEANPIVVVASADNDEGTIISLTRNFRILQITYTPTDIGDECILSDGNGDPIFTFDASVVAGQELNSGIYPRDAMQRTGLKIDTNEMDTGTLRIYLWP